VSVCLSVWLVWKTGADFAGAVARSEHLIRVARTELVDAMPAMPLGYFHDVAREGNCPKAEDSDGVARWALGMLRAKSPEEAGTSEYSLRLYEAICKDVSLVSLITRMLKVRRLCATIHVSTLKPNAAPHEYGAQEVCACPQYKPAVHMLLSAMATESSCRFKTWPRSRVVPGPLGGATHSRQQLGPLRPIVTAVPCPPPAKLILNRLENETALGKLLDANAYVEYVMANGR
jgi:hypothetical protein